MRDDHKFVVIQKSAQIGASELLVSLALWVADTGFAKRGNALFLMPTQNQMDDFSQARFDTAIADSPYLNVRVHPEPPGRKGANRLRLKKVGPGYVYFRGAESKGQITSVDADVVFLDEYDQMPEGTLELARKRVASSKHGRLVIASTPRFPDAGINALYKQSDQRRYYIPCPECGLEQPLTFDDNVDVERVAIVCKSCQAIMENTAPGKWVAEAPLEKAIRGYHLSRLYSPWLNLEELIEASQATSALELQEFHNSDLGEVFSPPGGGLSPAELDRCISNYSLDDYSGEQCVMGVDVGTYLHVIIREGGVERIKDERSIGYRGLKVEPKLWFAGTVKTFEELEVLVERFNVSIAVIDALPETRLASAFVKNHPHFRLAYYGGTEGYELRKRADGMPESVHMDRVLVIDETFERIRSGVATMPSEARQLGGRVQQGYGDYYRQLLAPQRTLEQDAHGNWVAKWQDNGKADHFAHAEVYCHAASYLSRQRRPWVTFL
jgi:hypothetical protein